jgi:hypothetical protein
MEAINDDKKKMLTLQKAECNSEIELEELKFNNLINRMFEFFINQLEDLKIAISGMLPDSIIQNYLIKLCTNQNNLEVGCQHWYYRNNFELESIRTTVKKIDSGYIVGDKFTVRFVLPILSQINRVFGVINVPIPIKAEGDEFFYLHYTLPRFIGIANSNGRGYSLDKCREVPFLGTRFCSTNYIYNSQVELHLLSSINEPAICGARAMT